jgi:hypothetical protein
MIPQYPMLLAGAAAGTYLCRNKGSGYMAAGALGGAVVTEVLLRIGGVNACPSWTAAACALPVTSPKPVAPAPASPAPTPATQMATVAAFMPGTAVHGYR